MIKQKISIQNKLGLHARASAKFVAQAGKFQSHIEVSRDNKTVNGKSIMGIMMLAASKDVELELCAEGPDEKEAIVELVKLINDKFGESE